MLHSWAPTTSSCIRPQMRALIPRTRQPFHFLPHPHGSPRPSLAHICSATMLPRVGECYHVRHTLTVWHGTASTSWACCHAPVTATRQHACPCRKHAWQSDLRRSRDQRRQLWGVTVAPAEQLWAPHAWNTPEPRGCCSASEWGLTHLTGH